MHYGIDYEILCTVDGTLVLAAFVPFHPEETPLLQVRYNKRCPLNLLNMHMTFDPHDFEEDAWTQTQCKAELAMSGLLGR